MTLFEFSEKIRKNNGRFYDQRGEILPIMIWQDLVTVDDFRKTIESKLRSIEENEFVTMARRPMHLPMRPVLKIVEADPYKAQDVTLNTRIFYPNIDEGWVNETETEVRVHMYYYEKV